MSFAERYGPWAVIAGASYGTGAAFARRIAAQGVSCVLIARRQAPLESLAEELRATSKVEIIAATCDLGADGAADRIVDIVGAREVGLYVNNAGADSNGARFLDKDVSAWRQLVGVNATTPMELCHHFGAAMRTRRRGGIVLINSGACYGGALGFAVYSASKAFNLCFSEGLWAELKPHGVEVLSMILGPTDTPAFRALLTEKGLPTPATLASPDEVSRIALEQLPHGPIYNWGHVADASPLSADERRALVEKISKSTIRFVDGA